MAYSRMNGTQNVTSVLGGLVQNGTKFVSDTVAIAKVDKICGGGRCLGAGVAGMAGGAVVFTAGVAAGSLGITCMVIGGLTTLFSSDAKAGAKLATAGAAIFALGSVAKVMGVVGMIGGGASAVMGTGLVVKGAQRKSISYSGATTATPVSTSDVSPQSVSKASGSLKDRLQIGIM